MEGREGKGGEVEENLKSRCLMVRECEGGGGGVSRERSVV